MEPTVCNHQYKLKITSFMVEIFPMGTKSCDLCGQDIHLNWLWRIFHVLSMVFGPGSIPLIMYMRFTPLWACILIFVAAWSLSLLLTWQITLHGKYVLTHKKGAVKQ